MRCRSNTCECVFVSLHCVASRSVRGTKACGRRMYEAEKNLPLAHLLIHIVTLNCRFKTDSNHVRTPNTSNVRSAHSYYPRRVHTFRARYTFFTRGLARYYHAIIASTECVSFFFRWPSTSALRGGADDNRYAYKLVYVRAYYVGAMISHGMTDVGAF